MKISYKNLVVLYIVLVSSLLSCNWERYNVDQNYTSPKLPWTSGGISTIELDSCEYIYIDRVALAHKGNCKYCEIRKNKKQ